MIGRRITTIITKSNDFQDAVNKGAAQNDSNHREIIRTGILSFNERKVTNMSTNDTMEITRKASRSDVRFWGSTQEEVEMELYMRRKRVFESLDRNNYRTLNNAYQTLVIGESREGLTLGWEFVTLPSRAMTDLFTWAFCADGTVELTFHNLQDITILYKPEEELA